MSVKIVIIFQKLINFLIIVIMKRIMRQFSTKYKFMEKTLCFPIYNPIFPAMKVNFEFKHDQIIQYLD